MEKSLNRAQREAAEDFEHNILLYAGAGTGKTYTIAQKVKKILSLHLARPSEILCLTFTLKASNEMKRDIESEEKGSEVEVKTIHSFCYSIVKKERALLGREKEPIVCDEIDEEELLKKYLPQKLSALFLEKESGLPFESIEKFDNVFLGPAKLSDLPPKERRENKNLLKEGFFRKLPQGYLSPYGILSEEEGNLRLQRAFFCPECGRRQIQEGNFCVFCGFDFRFYLPPVRFSLAKYGNIRNFLSLIKHCRALQGFESDNLKEDYTRAFQWLEERDGAKLIKSISYPLKGAIETDFEFFSAMKEFVGEALEGYEKLLKESNRLDFDDLIIEARRLLKRDDVLSRFSYRFLIVDEMQDTSELEYDVLKRLFPAAKVMMCGDFLQAIYEWRGSKPSLILNEFKRDFSPKEYHLSENYRSTKILTHAAFGYLKNTFPDEIGVLLPCDFFCAKEEEGEKIRFVACASADPAAAEAEFLFRYLLKAREDPSKICVMARSNRYIGALFSYFHRFNRALDEKDRLNFFTVGQNYRFFKTPVVKDALAFFSLLLDEGDFLSFERIGERYVRGIGPVALREIREGEKSGLYFGAFFHEETYRENDPFAPLLSALKEGKIVVYDTETTGLDSSFDEIVQIAAVKYDRDGNKEDSFMRFILPNVPLSEGAQKTHGYSLEFLKENGVSKERALAEFSEFIEGKVLVGHNSTRFDRKILDRELKEVGKTIENEEFDTLFLSRLFCKDSPSHKLSALCERFNIVNERAHDAFADVEATGKLLFALAREFLFPTMGNRERLVKRYKARFLKLYNSQCAMKGLEGEALYSYLKREFRLFERCESELERESLNALFSLAREKEKSGLSQKEILKEILLEAAFTGSEMDLFAKKLNKIPIITVHQAKGSEFDTVLLAGADERMFPIFSTENEEEEKRLFYVAITRAKRKLVITCRVSQNLKPSAYLSQIPEEDIIKYTYQ